MDEERQYVAKRFGHAAGGTGGVSHLRKMLDTVLFPEIWRLRTDL